MKNWEYTKTKRYDMSGNQYHPFHLVEPSPWPYVGAMGTLALTVGSVMYFHSYKYGDLIAFTGLVIILIVMVVWWRDIIREATYQGHHSAPSNNYIKFQWHTSLS